MTPILLHFKHHFSVRINSLHEYFYVAHISHFHLIPLYFTFLLLHSLVFPLFVLQSQVAPTFHSFVVGFSLSIFPYIYFISFSLSSLLFTTYISLSDRSCYFSAFNAPLKHNENALKKCCCRKWMQIISIFLRLHLLSVIETCVCVCEQHLLNDACFVRDERSLFA